MKLVSILTTGVSVGLASVSERSFLEKMPDLVDSLLKAAAELSESEASDTPHISAAFDE